jgi:TRAP-type mannitol/chloroaromatic compound transport system permease small subunit
MIDLFLAIDKKKTKLLEIMNTVACFWIFVLMIIITIDVFGRVLFNSPFKGTPELVSNSILAITFLEIPYVLYRGNHVRSTMLIGRMKRTPKYIFELIALIIGVIMMVFLIQSSWPDFIKAIQIGEYEGEGALRVPTYPTRGIIIFGSLLMVVEYIFLIVKRVLIHKGKIGEENIQEEGGQ